MSFESHDELAADGRRAAHVKWDGKTIALGTFSALEAAEKCNRAKALTKKWRTTMIPKPDVDWVKNTLERLNIRVVNDRPGRRKKRSINEVEQNSTSSNQRLLSLAQSRDTMLPSHMNPEAAYHAMDGRGVNPAFSPFGGAGVGDASLNPMERRFSNPSHYGGNHNPRQRGLTNSVLSNLPNPGNAYNMAANTTTTGYDTSSNTDFQHENTMSNNARRGNNNETQRSVQRSNDTQQQLAGLTFGSSQHYEVLKEHHLNLLKELQETTTLMNMYHNTNSNHQPNMEGLGSNLTRGGRNRESFDPFLEQSLLAGQNQLYASPISSTRDSFGIGGNFQGRGMPQLGVGATGNQYEQQLANAVRGDSLRAGMSYPMSMNESGNIRMIGDRRLNLSNQDQNPNNK